MTEIVAGDKESPTGFRADTLFSVDHLTYRSSQWERYIVYVYDRH